MKLDPAKAQPINKRVLLKTHFIGGETGLILDSIRKSAANAEFHEVVRCAPDVPEELGLHSGRIVKHISAAADMVAGDEGEYILVHYEDIISVW